jgi:hypothetical protein
MHYGWRRRSGSSHRRYWKALIVPLFAVAVILLGVLWEVSYGDADSSNRNKVPPGASKSDVVFAAGPGLGDRGAGESGDAAGVELDASRHELAALRQELAKQRMALTEGNAALIIANQKVQALESELAAAKQKQADAKEDRAEALRVAGKMWEDWRRLRQNLNTACSALAAGNVKLAPATCSTTDQN